MASERALIVFVKNPEPGQVKTRLAEDTDVQRALDIYIRLIRYTAATISGSMADVHVYYSDEIPETEEFFQDHSPHVQDGNGLGERMYNALRDTLETYQSAILIGSDCGELTTDILEDAFALLNDHDIVIGPAVDGGYYLIGMNSSHRQIFSNINWSTPEVLDKTKARITALGLRPAFLPQLRDVDTLEDWLSLGWE